MEIEQAAAGGPARASGGDAAAGPGLLECQKRLFSLEPGVRYLNCAFMSPLALAVEQAGLAGMRRKRNPAGVTPADFFENADEARRQFAKLVRLPDPARVAIVPAVSYAVATVARNTAARRGQNIVVLGEQFPSNVHVWRKLCQTRGLELRTVQAPTAAAAEVPAGAGRGAEWNARLLEAIDGRTAVVALEQVHWTDGTFFDLEQVGRRARECGAALVVDGTQSVGALPFDCPLLQPDALVCAGYKWLLGPYSIGLAYFGPRYDGGEPLEEGWIARAGSEDFRALVDYKDEYQPGAIRYDVGERSNFILLPMLLAALRLVLEWQPERVQRYCAALTAELLDEAATLGYLVESPAWRGAHLFGLRVPAGMEQAKLRDALARRGVSISLRGSAVRVSPHVYNDEEDVAALLEGLHEAMG